MRCSIWITSIFTRLCLSKASRYCCLVSLRALIKAYSSSSIISSSRSGSMPLSACFRAKRSLASSISLFLALAAISASFISERFSRSSCRFCSKASSKACPSFAFHSAKIACLSGGRSVSVRCVRSAGAPSSSSGPASGGSASCGGLEFAGATPTAMPLPSTSSPTSPSLVSAVPPPAPPPSPASAGSCGGNVLMGRFANSVRRFWYSFRKQVKDSYTMRRLVTSISCNSPSRYICTLSSSSFCSSGAYSSYCTRLLPAKVSCIASSCLRSLICRSYFLMRS
mmetsp:Transcript_32334/g.77326  ORF Transcript_32334/g.77326 Transcript_32334/m.77326 type:complete len:282 (+) Transcript_32334:266-1111(+)